MKNKLVVEKGKLDRYVCYLVDDKYYQVLILDNDNLISLVSNRVNDSDLFFCGFNEFDIEMLKYSVEDYFFENDLNDDILYDVDYNICDYDFSIFDYLRENNLIMKNNVKILVTGIVKKEQIDDDKIKVTVIKRKKENKFVKKLVKRN